MSNSSGMPTGPPLHDGMVKDTITRTKNRAVVRYFILAILQGRREQLFFCAMNEE
jgi:hypothetical protein